MMKRIFTFFLFLIVGCIGCYELWALEPGKAVNQYVHNHWTRDKGLPSDSIMAVTQTADGFLWIASRKKLSRFDGVRFKRVQWQDEKQSGYWSIMNMLVSRDNTLWIGVFGKGVFRLTPGESGHFEKVKNLSGNRVLSMFSDLNNNLWVSLLGNYLNSVGSGDGKVGIYGPADGLVQSQINCIFSDSRGRMLVGTQDGGLYRRSGGIFKKVRLSRRHNVRVDNISVNSVCEDTVGNIWIGTDNGLIRYSEKGSDFYTEKDGLSHRSVSSLITDSHGNLWVGTVNGLNRIKADHEGSKQINSDTTLDGHWVTCLFEDREKGLWVGTRGKGLYQLQDGKMITFTRREGLPNGNVVSLFQDRGKNIWVGTSGSLVKFNEGNISKETMTVPMTGMQISGVAQDLDGHIWVATVGSGLFYLKGEKKINVTVSDGLLTDTVGTIAFDSHDHLWVGSQRGLNQLPARDRLSFRPGVTFRVGGADQFVPAVANTFSPGPIQTGSIHSYTTQNGLAGEIVLGIFESPSGNLLISSTNGLNRIKNKKISRVDLSPLGTGLIVSNIYFDRSNPDIMWLATMGHGVVKIENKAVRAYTAEEGMHGNRAYQIFEDAAGFFWMSSDIGIIKIDKSAFFQLDRGEIERLEPVVYGRKDGMKTDECTRLAQQCAIQTDDGRLLFATAEGIVIVEPGNLKVNPYVPAVIIESVFADRKLIAGANPRRPLESLTPLDETLSGFNDVRRLDFLFTAPSFITPAKCRFRFRLENVEKEGENTDSKPAGNGWKTLPPGVRWVTVEKPSSGDYKLEIVASNSDGVWNSSGAVIKFSVRLSFFHSALFKYILFFMGTGVLLVLFRLIKVARTARKKSAVSSRSPLEEEKSEDHLKKLLYLVEVEKIYRDEDLSLSGMAAKLGVPTYYLSQLLNERVGKNFHDFLNSHRIDEACKRLADKEEKHVNILQIAIDAGFNSKVSFNRVFKKYTGTTPSQYRRKHLAGK